MHGRLKVRTSEQELALKRQKQQKRLVAYKAAMSAIAIKREANEYDQQLMDMTGDVLAANPDINTLWNVRRECLLRMQQADPQTEAFRRDLEFTLLGLQANPKSYCAWHHRRWCLETCAQPDWKHELDLCTRYLKLDERNFHVWDHRRYVAQISAIPAADELRFCTEKIDRNFSNYSSWHYRSKLLPQLHPHPTDASRPIAEHVLRAELEKVLSATFTAPDDSSAWFYQRWLLGNSVQRLDIAAFKVTATRALVTFTQPVNLNHERCALRLDAVTRFEMRNWRPVGITAGAAYSTIWMLHDSFALNAESAASEFVLEFSDEHGGKHELKVRKRGENLLGVKMPRFGHEFEESVREELEGQLRSYDELREIQREEKEPESKWALLTTALMMRAIDRTKFHGAALDNLAELRVRDPFRTGYYRDLGDKWLIEDKLEKWIEADAFGELDLSALASLRGLQYDQYLCVADVIRLPCAGDEKQLSATVVRHLRDVYEACGVDIRKE